MDLIFLAVIAVIIGWRLFSIIGQDLGGNKDAFSEMSSMADKKPVVAEKDEQKQADIIDINPADTPLNQTAMDTILSVEPDFDIANFMNGAKICFANTLEAFAEGNKEALEQLLIPESYAVFAESVDTRLENGERSVCQVVGFIKVELLNAEINNDMLEVEVDFTTDQINALYDSEDRVIQGHPTEIVRLQDDWVFVRKIGDTSPNWYVKETS